MEQIYTWIRNIVIYMILNTIIMNLLGNKSYKKYISIVSGMILVLIVISPLVNLIKLDEILDYNFKSNDFAIETADFKNNLARVEKEQRTAVLSEYNKKIKSQVEELLLEEDVILTQFDVTINMDYESILFGEVTGMEVKGTMNNKKPGNSGKRLDSIEIEPIIIGEKREKEEQVLPSPTEITLKNKLADFYNMEQGNIIISIQGG